MAAATKYQQKKKKTMAEVRQRFGRAFHNFTLSVYNRSCGGIQKNKGKGKIQTVIISPSFLSDGFLNGGAQSVAGSVTAEVLQDGYRTITARIITHSGQVWGHENNNKCVIGLREHLPLNNARVHRTDRNKTMFQRTLGAAAHPRMLCRGQEVRGYSSNGTRSEPLYKSQTGYYDILQVTPKATQAQIKTAYYKQSFIYHPDRNAGSDEATAHFSEISEAYTVLGNKSLKKKYDLGLLSLADLTATVRPSRDTRGGSARDQKPNQRSVVDKDRQGGVFDFDTFFKEHYSEQLQKQKDLKDRRDELLKRKHESIADKNLGKMSEMGLILMLLTAFALLLSIRKG